MPSFESAGTEIMSEKWVHLLALLLTSLILGQQINQFLLRLRRLLEEQEPLVNYL